MHRWDQWVGETTIGLNTGDPDRAQLSGARTLSVNPALKSWQS
ncbi:hypothetical protein SynBMKMC1_02018 [Synechococcus sp. BMK-MC-1]|nr:hypothetical protein SynBMKMC1_02018 [Synechococcus sp. BMK-MC-1]